MRRYLINQPMYSADTGGGAGGGTAGGAAVTAADPPADTKTDPPPADPPAGQPASALNEEELFSKMQTQLQAIADEAVKKAGMSPEEKAAHEQTQRQTDLDKREQAIAKRELRAETAQILAAKKLPAEALEVVLGADKAETEKNIAAFTAMFDAAVQNQVEARLAGKTPPAGQEQKTGDDIRSQFKNALNGF